MSDDGDDTLSGGTGNDTLSVGSGSDRTWLTGGSGHDVFDVAGSTYTVVQDLEADEIVYLSQDIVAKFEMEDVADGVLVTETYGSAVLSQVLIIGVETDDLFLGLGDARAYEGNLFGGGDGIILKLHAVGGPTEQADWIEGTELNDVLDGLGGADTLIGGLGADVISGGSGADVIVGDQIG